MHTFPHEDFIAQCKELGYELCHQCRNDGTWTGGFEGTYGKVEIYAYASYSYEVCAWTVHIYGDETLVAMFICKRHSHGWKRWFASAWADWLKGVRFKPENLEKAEEYQWGQT
jgi:hypothetical protein